MSITMHGMCHVSGTRCTVWGMNVLIISALQVFNTAQLCREEFRFMVTANVITVGTTGKHFQ